MPGEHRPLIRPHRPDYVPASSRYVRSTSYRPRRVSLLAVRLLVAAVVWLFLAAAVTVLMHLNHQDPGVVPGRGVHTAPNPGGFTSMPHAMYKAPVIPGPAGARRARLVPAAAVAAGPGQPGHMEKLVTNVGAVWPLQERWLDL